MDLLVWLSCAPRWPTLMTRHTHASRTAASTREPTNTSCASVTWQRIVRPSSPTTRRDKRTLHWITTTGRRYHDADNTVRAHDILLQQASKKCTDMTLCCSTAGVDSRETQQQITHTHYYETCNLRHFFRIAFGCYRRPQHIVSHYSVLYCKVKCRLYMVALGYYTPTRVAYLREAPKMTFFLFLFLTFFRLLIMEYFNNTSSNKKSRSTCKLLYNNCQL